MVSGACTALALIELLHPPVSLACVVTDVGCLGVGGSSNTNSGGSSGARREAGGRVGSAEGRLCVRGGVAAAEAAAPGCGGHARQCEGICNLHCDLNLRCTGCLLI